jgi:LacI family transcriptional regulator
MKRATIIDVAKLAGVSISSVSRFLAEPDSIRPKAAQAVRETIKELDYIPNSFAQNLKRKTSNIIAVILPDISDHFFSEACKSICTSFYENRYFVMICDTDNDSEKERFYLDEMIRDRVAGILLAPCGKNTKYIQQIVQNGPPLLLFDRMEPDIAADVVSEDNVHSGYVLARYMLEAGHRRFAILSGSEHSINMRYRLAGIKKAFLEFDVAFDEEFSVINLLTKIDAAKAFESVLQKEHCPHSILACNTILLDGVMLAASRMKLAIPADYHIAGFCVEAPHLLYSVKIPVVMQMPTELGRLAGEQMLRRLADKEENPIPQKQLLQTRLYLPSG